MTPIEIMALVVSLLMLIKIIVILIKPKSWLIVIRAVYAKPIATIIASFILALVFLLYLLQELTVVQIFAAMLLFIALIAMSFSLYYDELKGPVEKIYKDRKLIRRSWFPIIIWLILIFWTLFKIFS